MKCTMKMLLAFSLVLTLGMVGSASATVVWDNGGVGNDWSTPGNWDTNTVPVAADGLASISLSGADAPTVSLAGMIGSEVKIGDTAVGELNIVGGDLHTDDVAAIGESFDGTLNMSGGVWRATPFLFMGDGPSHGQINMTGGLLSTQRLVIGSEAGSTAHIQLDGGEVFFDVSNAFFIGGLGQPNADGFGTIDLAGGILSNEGAASANVIQAINAGQITGFGSSAPGAVVWETHAPGTLLGGEDGKTIFRGVPEPSSLALVALSSMGLMLGRRRKV